MGAGIGEGEGSGRGGSPLWMVVWFLLLWFIGETDLREASAHQKTKMDGFLENFQGGVGGHFQFQFLLQIFVIIRHEFLEGWGGVKYGIFSAKIST